METAGRAQIGRKSVKISVSEYFLYGICVCFSHRCRVCLRFQQDRRNTFTENWDDRERTISEYGFEAGVGFTLRTTNAQSKENCILSVNNSEATCVVVTCLPKQKCSRTKNANGDSFVSGLSECILPNRLQRQNDLAKTKYGFGQCIGHLKSQWGKIGAEEKVIMHFFKSVFLKLSFLGDIR